MAKKSCQEVTPLDAVGGIKPTASNLQQTQEIPLTYLHLYLPEAVTAAGSRLSSVGWVGVFLVGV